jgi:hypothetical protein
LAELNARHVRNPASAARTLLFDVELVDRNFPTMLDGRSLPELLTLYDVIDSSGGMLVLRRSDAPRAYRFQSLTTRHARFDELTDISAATADGLVWVNFHFRRRLGGKVLSMLYKPPTLGIEVHTRGTEPQSYRLLPSLAEEPGFLLSPLIPDRQSFAGLASGKRSSLLEPQQVTAVKVFVADAEADTYFDEGIEIELKRLEIQASR